MKKILTKMFSSRSLVLNWLIIALLYMMIFSFVRITDLNETIRTEQYLRICPEPYVCVIPSPNWSARPFMGLTIFKRIPV